MGISPKEIFHSRWKSFSKEIRKALFDEAEIVDDLNPDLNEQNAKTIRKNLRGKS